MTIPSHKTARIYKFMRTADLPYVLENETLKLSTLSHYRGLEAGGKIGDPNEGIFTNYVDHLQTYSDDVRLNAFGIYCGNTSKNPPGRVTLESSFVENMAPESLVFCASIRLLDELSSEMCHRGDDKYDTCFEIRGFTRLANAIYRDGLLADFGNEPLGNYVDIPECKQVTYEPVSAIVPFDDPKFADPFRKSRDHEFQQEIRAVFPIIRELPASTLIVRVPSLRARLREVFRDLPTPTAVPTPALQPQSP